MIFAGASRAFGRCVLICVDEDMDENGFLPGGDVLMGFELPLHDLFAKLESQPE
jgi:hypothetical protein